MNEHKKLPINSERYWSQLMTLGDITEPDRPWTRRSFSPMFQRGREWLTEQFIAAGLTVRLDNAGNLIGRLEGSEPELGTLMIGSHSDTVPRGGRFDGPAGIIAGLEVVNSLREHGRTLRHSLEIVDFLAEEPSEFGLSCVGSRGIVGELDSEMLAYQGPNKDTLAEAMVRIGADPDRLGQARRQDIAGFFELHIEQGCVLEEYGIDLGIVTAIVGITRIAITFTGQAAHAGTTPMHLRRDVMSAVTDMLAWMRDEAIRISAEGQDYFVATAGELQLVPNAANVVPGKATLLLDIRCDNRATMEAFLGELEQQALQAANRHRVELADFHRRSDTHPAICESAMMSDLRNSAGEFGFSHQDMTSGAGHDAAFLSRIAPMAMVFVPSQHGKSHCPEEWTSPEQLAAGVATLFNAVCRFDQRTS